MAEENNVEDIVQRFKKFESASYTKFKDLYDQIREDRKFIGGEQADTPAAVLKNWERIKQAERRRSNRGSALDGVPKSLPALLKARRTLEKAARNGYSEDIKPVEIEGDAGEFLLRVVSSIAAKGIDAESALEKTIDGFSSRFRAFEQAQASE